MTDVEAFLSSTHGPRAPLLPSEGLLKAVGRRFGITARLMLVLGEEDEPRLHHAALAPTRMGRLLGVEDVPLVAGGVGLDAGEAITRALGELTERYALYMLEARQDAVVASFAEMERKGLRTVPWEALVPFTREQYARFANAPNPSFRLAPLKPDNPLAWLEGVSLKDGKPTYAPAQAIAFGHRLEPGEHAYTYATSSGAGAGATMAAALLSGLYEQVERDAMMIRWYARIPGRPVAFEDHPQIGPTYRARLAAPHISYRMLDARLDLDVPVFLAWFENGPARDGARVLGSCANLGPSRAALKALVEAVQGMPMVKRGCRRIPYASIDLANLSDLTTNVRYYSRKEHASLFASLLDDGPALPLEDVEDRSTGSVEGDLRWLAGHLLERGLDPIAFDLTSPELREMGVFAARTWIPELVQLGVPYAPFLGNRRLYEMSWRLGRASGPIGGDALRADPHPYP